MHKIATTGLIILFSLTIVFHLLVLTGIIPYGLVWGGRLQSPADMYRFEAGSIFVNVAFLFIMLANARILRVNLSERILTFFLFFMAFLFLLNTVGNLLSNNPQEKLIFTPITAIIFGLTVVLIRHKRKERHT